MNTRLDEDPMIIIKHSCGTEESFIRYCRAFCLLMAAVAVALSLTIFASLVIKALEYEEGNQSYRAIGYGLDNGREAKRRMVLTLQNEISDDYAYSLYHYLSLARSDKGLLGTYERTSGWGMDSTGTRVYRP